MARDDDPRRVVRGSAAVQSAARRILAGDESISAANALLSAILLDHADEEDLEDLLYALAAYSPGGGREYYGVDQLRAEILDALGAPGGQSGGT